MMDEVDDTKERFLCNDHPRPELLLRTYSEILKNEGTQKMRTYEDISRSFRIPERNIPFFVLEILGILDKKRGYLHVGQIPISISELGTTEEAFRFFILNAIARKTWREGRFGKQAHFLVIYQWLLASEVSSIDYKDTGTIGKINSYFERVDYRPKTSGRFGKRTIKINDVKLHYWCILASYLGLVTPGPVGQRSKHLVIPSPRLTEISLEFYLSERKNTLLKKDSRTIIPLRDYIEWSSGNFIIIPLISGSRLPRQIAYSLRKLVSDGRITLSKSGDYKMIEVSEEDDEILPRRANVVEVRKR